MIKELLEKLEAAKAAARTFAAATPTQRSVVLSSMAANIKVHADALLAANRKDIELAIAADLEKKRINILTIGEKDILAMADFFEKAAAYEDPVGKLTEFTEKANGLRREQRLFPLGVIAVVYEARPSVVTDCAALCMRTGNALLLHGSRHAKHTDRMLENILRQSLQYADLPEALITLIEGDHETSYILSRQDRLIDLMILRGGYNCLEDIKAHATVPVIGAGPGNCHIYIDRTADPEMAKNIVFNSKVPRPLACNAAETLLIQRDWAEHNLVPLLESLKEAGIGIRGCPEVCKKIPWAKAAGAQDWEKEYFAPMLAVRILSDVKQAVEHINTFRTPHTECIITENTDNADYFMTYVEANVICHNASTRLTDGIEFDLGGEMGISTQKYPCGGPIGMEYLMQKKYFLKGNGTLR